MCEVLYQLSGTVGRRLRGTFDYAAIGDRDRMPWRFQARFLAVDGPLGG